MKIVEFETRRLFSNTPGLLLAACLLAGPVLVTAQAQPSPQSRPWNQCCGTTPWPMMQGGQGMMGGGMMRGGMMGGSMPRHHFAMMSGLPVAYRSLSNPLPRDAKTVAQGEAIYAANCSACHGATGAGDGPKAKGLSPPPANLQFLAQMPMVQWDSFMYWTVSEGGAQFGSAMPAFKGSLSDRDRWAVIAYVQARLPQKAQ